KNVEEYACENRDDDKQHHARGGRAVVQVAAAESLSVDEHGGRHGGLVGTAELVEPRDVEHLQAADEARDQGIQNDGPYARQRYSEEGLERAGPVYFSALKERGTDAEDAGDQHDHGVPVPEPELDEGHDIA